MRMVTTPTKYGDESEDSNDCEDYEEEGNDYGDHQDEDFVDKCP